MKRMPVNRGRMNASGQSCPLVSVVIPVYNVESYLQACVDSVLHQTYTVFEIILVDDGSTDDSGKICDVYQANDSRVKVIHQLNYGLGYARNVGMKAAKGKYIIFLDSDDCWLMSTLEELVYEAENNKLQVIVFSAYSFYDGISAKEYKGPSYSLTVQNNVIKTGVDSLSYAKAHGQYYAQACLRFYRLDYLRSNGFQFDEGIIHEDESFSFLAYIHADRVECLGKRYYQRRYRPGSIMMTRNPARSAHGYRVAIETLTREMEDRTIDKKLVESNMVVGVKKKPLSPDEKELYIKQIRAYIFSIFSLYREARKMKDDVAADWIATDTQRMLKTVCGKSVELPVQYRVMFGDYRIGYGVWRIRNKMVEMNMRKNPKSK